MSRSNGVRDDAGKSNSKSAPAATMAQRNGAQEDRTDQDASRSGRKSSRRSRAQRGARPDQMPHQTQPPATAPQQSQQSQPRHADRSPQSLTNDSQSGTHSRPSGGGHSNVPWSQHQRPSQVPRGIDAARSETLEAPAKLSIAPNTANPPQRISTSWADDTSSPERPAPQQASEQQRSRPAIQPEARTSSRHHIGVKGGTDPPQQVQAMAPSNDSEVGDGGRRGRRRRGRPQVQPGTHSFAACSEERRAAPPQAESSAQPGMQSSATGHQPVGKNVNQQQGSRPRDKSEPGRQQSGPFRRGSRASGRRRGAGGGSGGGQPQRQG